MPGWEGIYDVSDLGRVRRVISGGWNTYPGREFKGTVTKGGYRRGRLRYMGRAELWFFHELVAAAFIGPKPAKMEVNHKNTIKADNRLANLEYVTHKRNLRHASEMGLFGDRRGERNGNDRLTEGDVKVIRILYSRGWCPKELASRFGVVEPHLLRVAQRKAWKHI